VAGDLVLAIETSCDDTCASVVDMDGTMRSNVISSQHVHDRFGGVVPEIASRHHLEVVNVVLERALNEAGARLEQVALVAATQGPGLIGALLVGLSAGKAIAAARELPMAPVDHLQGHVAANFLGLAGSPAFEPPFVCLIASGGHTLLCEVREHDGFELLGTTLDDAAGEAFDKGARMLGLGYPGGPALERLAAAGDPESFRFPSGAGTGGLDFSFAGVKTALWYRLQELPDAEREARRADLAASYQHAIVAALVVRVERALARTGIERLAVGGGVAANGELRTRLEGLRAGAQVHIPPRELCTDNAAMIASAARFVQALPYPDYLSLDAYAAGELSRARAARRVAAVAPRAWARAGAGTRRGARTGAAGTRASAAARSPGS
jgi:N6-L-threonylcarbamoyladenine synthase